MKNIDEFFNKKIINNKFIIKRFMKLIMNKTKEQIREIEIQLLKPEPIPFYNYKKDKRQNAIDKKTISLILPDVKYLDLWSRHFRISKHIKNNSYDTAFIVKILQLIDKNRIQFDSSRNEYYLISKNNRKIKI